MDTQLAPLLPDLGSHGVTFTADVARLDGRQYADWAVFPGRPHRHEFGEFLRRWVLNRGSAAPLLITASSDRPVRPFMKRVGIEWLELPEWSSFARGPQPIWSPSLGGAVPSLGQRGELTADVQAFGRPLLEQDMELFLDQHPDWLTRVLGEHVIPHPAGRQFRIERGRLDLLVLDDRGRTCVIECKRGALHTSHLGQVIEYERPGDAVVGGARLILLVNTANVAYDDAFAAVGIEIRRFPIGLLVDGMRREGFQPMEREARRPVPPVDEEQPAPWKQSFIGSLTDNLPAATLEKIAFRTKYKPEKKIACYATQSGASVFYVGSNSSRLEICLSIVHEVLRAGGEVPFAPRRTHVVYFGKTSTLLTTAIPSDEAASWLIANRQHVRKGIEALEAGLEASIQAAVLNHFGAVFQNHNALKGEADGMCRGGSACPYDHA